MNFYCPRCEETELERYGGGLWCPRCSEDTTRRKALRSPRGRPRSRSRPAPPSRPSETRHRAVADGGRVQVPVIGDVHPMLLAGGALAVYLGLRSVSGDSTPSAEAVEGEAPEGGEEPVWVEESDGEVECPECGDGYTKNGMIGHLRWKHDYEMDDIRELGDVC